MRPTFFAVRSKWLERFHFSVAALAIIIAAVTLYNEGATGGVVGNVAGAVVLFGFGYAARHARKMAEFEDWRAGH